MFRSPEPYLRHILDETDYLAGQVKRLTREQFLADETVRRADRQPSAHGLQHPR